MCFNDAGAMPCCSASAYSNKFSNEPEVVLLDYNMLNTLHNINGQDKQRSFAKPKKNTKNGQKTSRYIILPYDASYWLPLCLTFYSILFNNCVSCRLHKRILPSNHSDNFAIAEECYHRYEHSDHYQTLVDWLHRKNESHYSPISPSYNEALLKIRTSEMVDGLQITTGASTCNSRKMKAVVPTTPLRERALCQFEYILNYNPNRIPSTLTEVKCSCQHPSHRLVGKRPFECEPLHYNVRVLLFDTKCQTFIEDTETIAMACIPVSQASIKTDDDADLLIPASAPSVPT
ncbi:interleukin-17 domain-containing protein [Ditylenchus destructor]|uniref:Interleukin-17 domain-containing protein n=1 Tax=Ditylenchus destructor TaxID=166010 RepID=A0AAD4R905_9BILA|nr:interleukin-17 domain-containing protein [Ditylenchus destructor]